VGLQDDLGVCRPVTLKLPTLQRGSKKKEKGKKVGEHKKKTETQVVPRHILFHLSGDL